jgi:hypothetical protein
MKNPSPLRPWAIGELWQGQDAFIIAGGTSVNASAVERLRTRPASRIIAVNSSYLMTPWADVLFFGDDRWGRNEIAKNLPALEAFEGQIVTVGEGVRHPLIWHMKKIVPTRALGLTHSPDSLAMERTSLQGALNICLHKKVRRIVLVGADNRDGPDGRIHHHPEHPWPHKPNTWNGKSQQVGYSVKPLADAGIEVINASLISTFPWWPKVDLATWLDEEDRNAQG